MVGRSEERKKRWVGDGRRGCGRRKNERREWRSAEVGGMKGRRQETLEGRNVGKKGRRT